MPAHPPLAASEIRFRSLFEHTPELIIYQNEAGTILDANPAFLAVVNQSREEVLGQPYNDFLPPAVRPLFTQKLHEAFQGHTVRFDLYASQGSSPMRHWDVMKVPLVENGAVVGVHMVSRDITEKVQSQEDIMAHNSDLQQFTYIVSHNLRAPLANALGLVDILGAESPGSPMFQQAQAHLQANLQHLDLVLRDMTTILTIRDQQDLLPAEAVPLAEVVEQVVEGLQEPLDQVGGAIEVQIPSDFRVQANRAYLHSIFLNLLSNAVKYRDAVRPLRVRVTAREEPGAGKRLEVADNGTGFDYARIGNDVFKLYQRFHPHHAGRGMGLYLVKTHVEGMGGRIEVSSQEGQGTCFTLYLP